jgi:hypothetical protein
VELVIGHERRARAFGKCRLGKSTIEPPTGVVLDVTLQRVDTAVGFQESLINESTSLPGWEAGRFVY